jgi:hypothetical protein
MAIGNVIGVQYYKHWSDQGLWLTYNFNRPEVCPSFLHWECMRTCILLGFRPAVGGWGGLGGGGGVKGNG